MNPSDESKWIPVSPDGFKWILIDPYGTPPGPQDHTAPIPELWNAKGMPHSTLPGSLGWFWQTLPSQMLY